MSRLAWSGEPPRPAPVHRTAIDPATGLELTMMSAGGGWSGGIRGQVFVGLRPIRVTAWASESARPEVCGDFDALEAFLLEVASDLRADGWERTAGRPRGVVYTEPEDAAPPAVCYCHGDPVCPDYLAAMYDEARDPSPYRDGEPWP